MSTAPPPSTGSRSDAIARRIREQILDGKYEPGERLPSERDLAARWGANRSSVREALKKLEELGMIHIRPGGGARVLPLEKAGLGVLQHLLTAERADRDFVAQWLDVWELVLSGAARLAVERGSAEEFARANALLERMAAPNLAPETFVEIGDALTELIAIASRNVVLQMVRNGLTAQLHERNELRLQLSPPRRLFLPVIRQIQAAIVERDALAVEEAVRRLVRTNRGLVLDVVAGRREDH